MAVGVFDVLFNSNFNRIVATRSVRRPDLNSWNRICMRETVETVQVLFALYTVAKYMNFSSSVFFLSSLNNVQASLCSSLLIRRFCSSTPSFDQNFQSKFFYFGKFSIDKSIQSFYRFCIFLK